MATKATKLTTTLETITPARAAKYLEHNTTNRRVRTPWRDQLAQTIREGRWRLTHQGIAFNCDGTLIDGQHRLMAIVMAGIAVPCYVTRGMDRDALYGIDQGRTRSVVDLSGPVGINANITSRHVSCARAMVGGLSTMTERINMGVRMNNEAWIEFILRHREAIEFAIGSLKTSPYKHSVMAAIVARAWYTSNRDRLAEWCLVLQNNHGSGSKDSAATVFAKWFLPRSHTLANGPARNDLYRRAQYALKAFLEHRNVVRIMPAAGELFPIPGEED